MKLFISNLKKGIILSIVLVVICGFIYPLAVTGVSKLIFPKQANGSIISVDGKDIGSEVVGQKFVGKGYFHLRVSAVNYNTYEKGDKDYKGPASGSENLAPSNPKLIERIKKDKEEFLKENPGIKESDIPGDLITSSASGLDPHISVEAAKVQVPRIAKETELSEEKLKDIVNKNTSKKTLGVFGENKVNVLKANIDIYKLVH